ncbi:hemin ABC transporter substrate-binding protein [Pyxidicoccus sp. 3LG]
MRRVLAASLLCTMLAAVAHAAEPAKASAPAPSSTGAAAQPVTTPKLVTIGPAVTETVFALGAGAQVVGVDDSSLSLPVAAKAPKVGYQRALSAEALLATGASWLLASDEAGPPGVLEQLRKAGVEVVVLPNQPTLENARQRIRTLAQKLGRAERGEALITELAADLERASTRAAAMKDRKPRVLALYARGANALMVAGTETATNELIRFAGGVNAVSRYSGHKPLTAEAVVEAAPEFILVPASSLQAMGGEAGLTRVPGLSQVRGWRVITIEDAYFMGLGPHLGKAVARLQDGFQ